MRYLFPVSLAVSLLFYTVSAQNEITVVGGINLSTISYNDSEINDMVDISFKPGIYFGAEKLLGNIRVGAGFSQRGASLEFDFLGENYSGTDTYNYFDLHGLYTFNATLEVDALLGLGIGYGLGGKTEFEGESDTIEGKYLNLDYGVLLGADYLLKDGNRIRVMYYFGLADVAKDLETDFNYRNRGLSIQFTRKITF